MSEFSLIISALAADTELPNWWSRNPAAPALALAPLSPLHLPQCRLISATLSTPWISLTTDLVATATQ